MGLQAGHLMGVIFGALIVFVVPAAFILSLIMLIISKKKGWLFLLIPSALAGLGLVALVGVGIAVGLKEAKKGSAPLVLKSTDAMVEISAPGNWKLLTKVNDDAQLQAGSLIREEYMLIFNEERADFQGNLGDFGKIVMGHLQKALSSADVSAGEKLTINGLDAIQYTASGSVKGVNVDYLVTVVESPKYYHQIVTWTLHSKKDRAFPVLREAAASFKIVKDIEAAEPAASPAK